MGAVKKGVIPRNAPLVKNCPRVISVIQDNIIRITSRNLADVPMCAGILPDPGLWFIVYVGTQETKLV